LNETKKVMFCFFTHGKQDKANEHDTITVRNHAPHHTQHDYPWSWVSLTWLLYNLQLWRQTRWFKKFTVLFEPIRKEIVSSMYNNHRKQAIQYVPGGWLLYASTLRQFHLCLLIGWKRMYFADTVIGNLCRSIVAPLPSLWNTFKYKANITLDMRPQGLLFRDRKANWKFKTGLW